MNDERQPEVIDECYAFGILLLRIASWSWVMEENMGEGSKQIKQFWHKHACRLKIKSH